MTETRNKVMIVPSRNKCLHPRITSFAIIVLVAISNSANLNSLAHSRFQLLHGLKETLVLASLLSNLFLHLQHLHFLAM